MKRITRVKIHDDAKKVQAVTITRKDLRKAWNQADEANAGQGCWYADLESFLFEGYRAAEPGEE